MLDFSDFFPEGSRPAQPMLGHGYLVHGARSSGKTSFAFQAAVNCVQRGASVVVLCEESSVYAKVPRPFVPLTSLREDALGRMEFIYVDSWPAVLRELVLLTRRPADIPALLLVDDDDLSLEDSGDVVSRSAFTESGGANHGQRAGGAGVRSHVNNMAQCFSFLTGVSDWLARCHQQPFTFIVVTNNGNCLGAAGSGGGAFSFAPAPLDTAAGGAVGLPFAAFPVVRVHVGASGSVQVTPTPCDRAEAVRKSFSLHWENGLRL